MENEYLNKAKKVALYMLDMEYEEIEDMESLFIIHPFFNSIFIVDKQGIFNIKEYPERFEGVKNGLRARINSCDEIDEVMAMILKPNKILFLYLLSQCKIPAKVCGNLLGKVWCSLENNDTQEKKIKRAMRAWLLAADKDYFMTQEELSVLKSLPDNIEIYRGAQMGEPADGFCWSLSRSVAEWFATRFEPENPIVYTTTIAKKDVLAYIDAAQEQEIVVDYTKINDIKIVELSID